MQNVIIISIKIVGVLFLMTTGHFSNGQDYAVSKIPKELKANAKAVIRQHNVSLYLNSDNSAKMEVQSVITILNENGLDDADFVQLYDKFTRIRDIKATLFDESGQKIRKIRADEIEDYSNVSGYSLFEDDRVKYIDPNHRTVPFTVEYSYTIVYNGILDYPDFYLLKDYNISVENANFSIISESGLNFRIKEKNMNPEYRNPDKQNFISWTFHHINALKQERFSLPFQELIPNIQIAPDEFKIDGYSGNGKTWEDFGKWNYLINEGRNELEEETKIKIADLVKDAESQYEKVKLIYEYMQNKTRYVNLQIGIGGWQTIDAKTVDKLSYGDCKALTNYTKSLCDAVGIKTHYTTVRAGRDAPPMMEDFPSNQFNHVMLCVPNDGDTLWLECTDQKTPFAYAGTFTSDRKVLLITEEGGKVVRTKTFSAEDNLQSRKIDVFLDADGNGKAKVNSRYYGIYYDYRSSLLTMDDKDKRNTILKSINVPNFDLLQYSHIEERSRNPFIDENLELYLNNYATLIGDKMLLRLNLMTRASALPYENRKRNSEINLRWPYLQSDTIIYHLPQNYTIDNIPKNKSISTPYGDYNMHITLNRNQIQFVRNLKLNKGVFPPEAYSDFFDFFENIANADGCKFSLIPKSDDASID